MKITIIALLAAAILAPAQTPTAPISAPPVETPKSIAEVKQEVIDLQKEALLERAKLEVARQVAEAKLALLEIQEKIRKLEEAAKPAPPAPTTPTPTPSNIGVATKNVAKITVTSRREIKESSDGTKTESFEQSSGGAKHEETMARIQKDEHVGMAKANRSVAHVDPSYATLNTGSDYYARISAAQEHQPPPPPTTPCHVEVIGAVGTTVCGPGYSVQSGMTYYPHW